MPQANNIIMHIPLESSRRKFIDFVTTLEGQIQLMGSKVKLSLQYICGFEYWLLVSIFLLMNGATKSEYYVC